MLFPVMPPRGMRATAGTTDNQAYGFVPTVFIYLVNADHRLPRTKAKRAATAVASPLASAVLPGASALVALAPQAACAVVPAPHAASLQGQEEE